MTKEQLEKAKELEKRIKSLRSFLDRTEYCKQNNQEVFNTISPHDSYWCSFLRAIKYSICPRSKRVRKIDPNSYSMPYSFDGIDDEFLTEIQNLCKNQVDKLEKLLNEI